MNEPSDSWEWFWSPGEDKLFSRNKIAGWHEFSPIHQHRTRYNREFAFIDVREALPTDCKRATVWPISDRIVVHQGAAGQKSPQENDRGSENSTEWDRVVAQNLNYQKIADGLQRGSVIGVADGSYMAEKSPKLGAAAWILERSG